MRFFHHLAQVGFAGIGITKGVLTTAPTDVTMTAAFTAFTLAIAYFRFIRNLAVDALYFLLRNVQSPDPWRTWLTQQQKKMILPLQQ